MRKKILPVYYHVPKCGGTFTKDYLAIGFRRYVKEKLGFKNYDSVKCFYVMEDHPGQRLLARVHIHDPYGYSAKHHRLKKMTWVNEWDIRIKISDFSKIILNENLFKSVFVAFITPDGIRADKQIIEILTSGFGVEPLPFLSLREPLRRSLSVFNYLKSERSKHESTHGKIMSTTFEQYIRSSELEINWVVRNMSGLTESAMPDESDLTKVSKKIKEENFRVFDLSELEKNLSSILVEYYDLDLNAYPYERWDVININKDADPSGGSTLKGISTESLELFNERMKLDLALYRDLCLI